MPPKKGFLLKLSLVFALLAIIGCAGPVAPSPTTTATPTPIVTATSTLTPAPTLPPTSSPTPTPTTPPTVQATPGRAIELDELTRIRSTIKVKAKGIVLHYRDESSWREDQYPVIMENKAEISSDLITKFVDALSRHSERGEHTVNAEVEFDESRKSTILRCDIHGAVSERDDSYYAVFSWLLRPLGLDFIDDDFGESEQGLFWEGAINGIPTTITVELPTIDHTVYEAWQHSIGHCHAHAW